MNIFLRIKQAYLSYAEPLRIGRVRESRFETNTQQVKVLFLEPKDELIMETKARNTCAQQRIQANAVGFFSMEFLLKGLVFF